MNRFVIEQDPLRVEAFGSTRAGLLIAAMKGLFAVSGIEAPEAGDEVKRTFSIEEADTPALLLALVKRVTAEAEVNREWYADIRFTLITDRKAVGSFEGRKLATAPSLKTLLGIQGEVAKEADGVWRAAVLFN